MLYYTESLTENCLKPTSYTDNSLRDLRPLNISSGYLSSNSQGSKLAPAQPPYAAEKLPGQVDILVIRPGWQA